MMRRARREREFAEELESHLAMHIEDNLRAGMSPEEARRVALVKLGGVTQAQELHREQRGLPMLEILLQDLRFGLRMLSKNPGFSFVAILTLALGIGANTAIFSVVNAILLRPLAFKDPDQLVTVMHLYPKLNLSAPVSAPGFRNYQERGNVFSNAAISTVVSLNLTGQGEPERIQARRVTASFFPTLGVEATLGRMFLAEEDQPGKNFVVVLSYGLWQRRFGGEANILGQSLALNGQNCVVIGVAPENFRLYPDDDLWIPVALTPEQMAQNREYLAMIARLKPGVSFAQAQAAINNVVQQMIWETRNPPSDGGWGVVVKPLDFVAKGPKGLVQPA